jgi:hypothetical protein
MMGHGDLFGHSQYFRITVTENTRTNSGVALHNPPLVVVELSGFQQYSVGNTDLSHIVERCRMEKRFRLLLAPPELSRHEIRHPAYPHYMPSRFVVPILRRSCKLANDLKLRFHQLARPKPHQLIQGVFLVHEHDVAAVDLEHVTDPDLELGDCKRFVQVIPRPGLQRAEHRFLIAVGAQNHDRRQDRQIKRLELFDDLIAVYMGHFNVEENNVRWIFKETVHYLAGVADRFHVRIALCVKSAMKHFNVNRVVIHHHNPPGAQVLIRRRVYIRVFSGFIRVIHAVISISSGSVR